MEVIARVWRRRMKAKILGPIQIRLLLKSKMHLSSGNLVFS